MVSQEKKSYQPGKYIEPANLFRILQQKYKVTTIEDPKLWNTVLDNRNDYSYDPQVEKGTYLFQVKIKSISGSGFHTIYYLLTSKDITPELAKALPTAP
ncbi:hypothetical protein D3C78_1565500 [compost metagenome]